MAALPSGGGLCETHPLLIVLSAGPVIIQVVSNVHSRYHLRRPPNASLRPVSCLAGWVTGVLLSPRLAGWRAAPPAANAAAPAALAAGRAAVGRSVATDFLVEGTNRRLVAKLPPKYPKNRKRHRIWAALSSNLEGTFPPKFVTGGDASPPLSTPLAVGWIGGKDWLFV